MLPSVTLGPWDQVKGPIIVEAQRKGAFVPVIHGDVDVRFVAIKGEPVSHIEVDKSWFASRFFRHTRPPLVAGSVSPSPVDMLFSP